MAKKNFRTRSWFSVTATYPAECYPQMDRRLENLAQAKITGSGMGLGERDISWTYYNADKAMAVFRNLKRSRCITSLSLSRNK